MPNPAPLPPSSDNVGKPDATHVPWERVEKFIGQFTHDIRNGLNALELQLTFLGEISTDPDAVAEVKQLRTTLAELSRQLQAVKLKTGSVTAHTMEYPAGDFFEDLRERFERQHPAAAARVQWKVTATGALLVDPELSITALLEILGNALHFCSESGEIQLTATADGSHGGVRLTIKHGLKLLPEIPLEAWGLTPLLSTRRGAYGLGLFRARRVLEAQGARFDASLEASDSLVMTILFLVSAGG